MSSEALFDKIRNIPFLSIPKILPSARSLSMIAALGFLFTGGAWTGVIERIEESNGLILGTVGAVHENSITIIYGKGKAGMDQEMVFQRRPEVKVIHKKWEEIIAGEPVKATFVEMLRVREGRNAEGVLAQEKVIISRNLQTLEFARPWKKKLVSGV